MKVILLLTIFLVPLIGATNNLGYEQIKVLFFIVLTSLIGLLWTGKGFRWSKISIAGCVFILILLLAGLYGIDPKVSFLGSQPYFQGWLLYAYLWLFSLIVGQVKIKLEHWAMALCSSAFLVGILAIYDWTLFNLFGQSVPNYAGRVVSTFGQPNFYAGFLLFILPFCYYLFKTSNRKLSYFGLTSGLISFAGIFISYSRSAILMALLLLILGLVDQLKIKFKIGLIILVVIITSIVIALKLSSGIVGNEISRPFQMTNPDLTKESVEKRAYIWPVAWQLVKQRLLTGYGLENIGRAFSGYFEVNKHSLFEENLNIYPVLISLKELTIDRTHNYTLDLLLSGGVLGLLGWLGLVGVLFKKLGQKYSSLSKNVLLVSLVVYLIWVQFQNQSIVQLIYFWLLVGLIDRKVNV